MKQLLIAGSIYNLAFAIFHVLFWKIFKWKAQLSKLDYINRSIMQVLNLCLTFCFLIFSYISFFHTSALIETNLGNTILAGISIFWLFRAIEQVLFFKFKHWCSVILLLIFICGSVIYAIPLFGVS